MAKPIKSNSSPRISYSGDYLDKKSLILTSPRSPNEAERREKPRSGDFEFLSSNVTSQGILFADEFFFEGKVLPFWQVQNSEKHEKICLKEKGEEEKKEVNQQKESATRVTSWYVDDDPSPRSPKCTVLWKELMRLRKQWASSLSPSSSSSSSSSSSCLFGGDLPPIAEGREGSGGNREEHAKRMKKGLERTRSNTIRIRPMVNALRIHKGRTIYSCLLYLLLRKEE